MLDDKLIQVFEFESLPLTEKPKLKEALDAFYGDKGVPYYDLTRTGVRFKNYVGVIQVGQFTIEVLPKIDKVTLNKNSWQSVLITMLRQSGLLKTEAPSSSSLRLKGNSILDLYIELFITECEYLINLGLIKKYRKVEANRNALRGALVMSKHITKNVVHKERFYVSDTVYNSNHILNQLLLKTLRLIDQVATSAAIRSRVGTLLLRFPELDDIKVYPGSFDRIVYDRKSLHYKKAIEITRLLLLNYHPDINKGRENVLALMFDMNKLWEAWVLRQMQKQFSSKFEVKGQRSKRFWIPEHGKGYSKSLIPDIVIRNKETNAVTVVDTKWKLPKDNRPADDDLKQMFSYNKLFDSFNTILLYPGEQDGYSGQFFHDDHGGCRLDFLNVIDEKGSLHPEGVFSLEKYLS
jgi:5-methylcytosine-specific restriction enzyme subunit McrC